VRDPLLVQAQATTREVGRTFALACRVLPRGVRDDIYLLYLVFRTLDDLVDAGDPRADDRLTAVEAWADWRPASSPEVDLLTTLDACHRLPRAALRDFCLGMRADLGRQPIDTEQELDLYCYQVAGTVGLVISAVLGVNDERRALPAAMALGQAMQRTNILRDIDEDRDRGRCYIARETVERFGPPLPGRREALLRDQIARADALFERGIAGISLLSRGNYAISAAARMYREILREIERAGFGADPGRAVVTTPRKFLVAAGASGRRVPGPQPAGRPWPRRWGLPAVRTPHDLLAPVHPGDDQ
jgi:phytoene synthase